jgi:hypothetical protein
MTDPIVMGYVSNLLACLRDRSVSIEGKLRVYQNTSQFEKDMEASVSCGPRLAEQMFASNSWDALETHLAAQTLATSDHCGDRVRLHSLHEDANSILHGSCQQASVPRCSEWATRSPDIRKRSVEVGHSCDHACSHDETHKQDMVPMT